MPKTKPVKPIAYTVPEDLLDYARNHDSDEAEGLLMVLDNEHTDAELYEAAKAFFLLLVAEETLDAEDAGDMLGIDPATQNPDDTDDDGLPKDDVQAAIAQAEDVDDLAVVIADTPED